MHKLVSLEQKTVSYIQCTYILGVKVQNIMGNQISAVPSLESTVVVVYSKLCDYYVSYSNLTVLTVTDNFE